MRYQDLKLRDATRIALIGLASGVISAAYFGARPALLPIIGDRFSGYAGGLAFVAIICWGVCLWYMLASPAQDARFLAWAKRKNFQRKRLESFDWELLDPSDPEYDLPTYRYAVRRLRKQSS